MVVLCKQMNLIFLHIVIISCKRNIPFFIQIVFLLNKLFKGKIIYYLNSNPLKEENILRKKKRDIYPNTYVCLIDKHGFAACV